MITILILLLLLWDDQMNQKDADEAAEAVLDKYAAIPTREAGPDVADAMMRELRDALSEYGEGYVTFTMYNTERPVGQRIQLEHIRLQMGGRGF